MLRVVNLQDVYMIEKTDPSYSNFGFKLKFYGKTPGDKDMEIVIEFPAWGVSEIAQRLHEVQRIQEQRIKSAREILEGKL